MAYIVKDAAGQEITHNGKQLFGQDIQGVVKGVDVEKRTLKIVATDETSDRDGDIIRMRGWKLDNYRKNPVFIWAHNYSSVPLAAAVKIEKQRSPGRMVLTHKFPSLGLHPFADMILELYNQKIINAGSVGFIPDEWRDLKTDLPDQNSEVRRRMKFGREFLSQELLEHSGCAVPANPSALQESVKAFSSKMPGKNILDFLVGKSPLAIEVSQDAVGEIEEIKQKGVEYSEETEVVQVQVPANFKAEGEEKPEGEEEKQEEPLKVLADGISKIGAVLNQKNRKRLTQASELILEVLKEAERNEEEDGASNADESLEQDDASKGTESSEGDGNIYESLLADEQPEVKPQPEKVKTDEPAPAAIVAGNSDSKRIQEIVDALQRIVDSIKL